MRLSGGEAMSNSPAKGFGDGPLSGIRVIDLSEVISGPFGAAMMGDHGADVIKVERLDTTDLLRDSGPLVPGTGISALFASINRNKRAMALDLKQDAGKEIL